MSCVANGTTIFCQFPKSSLGSIEILIFGSLENRSAAGLQCLGSLGPFSVRTTPIVQKEKTRFIKQGGMLGNSIPISSRRIERPLKAATI